MPVKIGLATDLIEQINEADLFASQLDSLVTVGRVDSQYKAHSPVLRVVLASGLYAIRECFIHAHIFESDLGNYDSGQSRMNFICIKSGSWQFTIGRVDAADDCKT